ncbi:MAG: transcriptional repressor LexA [Alphaproteobacteria bacterium]|nr:transcriptional repressor LexA [Alphaproteobacteria bacterium]
MLTRKQQELLTLIKGRMDEEGVPPSFDEMKDALGLASKSGIHRLITGLEERGFIRRLPHRARALEIVRMPENMQGAANTATHAVPGLPAIAANTLSLPLYGRIAAGHAIEALSDPGQSLEVPASLLGRGAARAEHYALEVDGDSMIEAGILDGDSAIIRRCERAERGDIVVALIDEQDVTLKYWQPKPGTGGGQIVLEPANKNYKPMVFEPERVRLQGKLVGLLRQY